MTANSIALLNKLEQHPLFIAAKTVLLYYSLGDEVQTHDFIEKWYRQKDILLPVVKGDILELRRYTGPQNLQTGEAYHIEEPTGEAFTDYTQIDFAIIPGVSFDKNGNRLGRGKGYYDRLLPQLHSYNVGICFDFQVSDEIPTESFDKPMHEVWTEKGRFPFTNNYRKIIFTITCAPTCLFKFLTNKSLPIISS